jgi:uncharacterized membrane protein
VGRTRPRHWFVPALLGIAAAGVISSGYLTITHLSSLPLVCTVNGVVNCSAVTHSAYSVIPGTSIPISVLGIAWFVILAAVALAARRSLQLAWTAIGLLVVIYLIYIEIVVLHQICEWCTVVHILIVASLLITIRQLQVEAT